jgi:hypothetical protein
VYGAARRTKPPGASPGQNTRCHGRGGASPTPDPGRCSSVRQGRSCARRGSRHAGAAPVGMPRPTAPHVAGVRTLGHPGATRRAPPGPGRRCRLDTITRRRRVELNASGCAESRKSADSSQRPTSSSGWSSTIPRRSPSRSASPVLRGPLGKHGARLGGRPSATARCSERTTRRSGRSRPGLSTRLLQPWRSNHADRRGRTSACRR